MAAQVVHSAGRRFIVSPVPEARLRDPFFGPPSANTSFEDSVPGLIYTFQKQYVIFQHISMQTYFVPSLLLGPDSTSASGVQQDQTILAPSFALIPVIPATTGGLPTETCIPPASQPSYQSPVPAAPAVSAQGSTSPPITTQQTRTGRTSPSPAPPEVPTQRRLSLPTPSAPTVGQQVEIGNLMVPSGGDQTLTGIQEVQVGPSSVSVVQSAEGEGDSQGKPPGIEDIHALDQKLRSLFKDTSQNSNQADGETSSPPNTVSTNASGFASSGHGTPSCLSLNSSGNFAPGAFATMGQAGTPTNLVQTSVAEPFPQRQQVTI